MGEQEQREAEAEAGGEASASAAASANSSSMQRVKVYRLRDGGKWDDQGTGHVAIDYIEGSKDLGLTVLDEDDNETLLVHNITSDDIYRKQEETIISWRDPEAATELALSFQEAAGCSYIWDNICEIQRNLQFSNLGAIEVGPRPASEHLEASRVLHSHDESFRSVNGELRELPPVDLSNLPLILKTILEGGITDQMRVAELITQDRDFFPKLLEIFRMCEDLENLDDLHMIFKLVRGIILLNSPSIFDKIFSDEFILDIIGALEYDPEVAKVQKHRTFLKDHVIFKEAIPIKNVSVVSRIHQTYRIGYLKDVILPRTLDDGTMASLNTMIHTNNAAVISLLKDDACFIQELFSRMRSPNISVESKRELVRFLHEFCTLSKSLPLVQQLRLFRDLSGEGVFEIISDVLQSQDRKIVSAGTDIVILFLNQDPNLLRSYIVQQEGNSLLGLLVKGMVTDFGEQMHCQFLEILRILMDSFTMSGAHRDVIIEIFYERHLDYLVDVIASCCPPRSITRRATNSAAVGRNTEVHRIKPEILLNICELLCFCVVHHPYRIKCNFLMNNAIEKILTMTRRSEKFLVVAAVRFMRTIISRNDEHLVRHVVKFNLLKPIIDAFVENGDRYNMLQSGVLELLEHIRKENLKPLVIYVIESFSDQLMKFEHFGSIQAFKLKYQQYLESAETRLSASVPDIRKKAEGRGLEKEEEDYFNEDSDEEDSVRRTKHAHDEERKADVANGSEADDISSRPKSGGLVDYADDDDEDFNPPPKEPDRPAEDDELLKISRVKRKSVNTGDGKHADGEVRKRQKIETRITCSKISALTSLASKHKDSHVSSSPSCEVNGIMGEHATHSVEQQHSTDTAETSRQVGGDCIKAMGNLSSEKAVNTTKTNDSEPYSVR
ncbi:serine/threonine-protein phosphatase 4 regulatory subunit 3B [Lolium rigidum]|uniref:serine/threonine-protein phosphatase 4 regulatory subunit 3B n=1 Tax=Lolium rigidum TaxID=89674 RepID=UPI001F5C6A72|nr:serine/threonine-protein phosphatase 4 regulatory subunit 3B [Lolium rigidum]